MNSGYDVSNDFDSDIDLLNASYFDIQIEIQIEPAAFRSGAGYWTWM